MSAKVASARADTETAANHPVYWLNGRIVAAEQARISVLDHGLLYGDGVFEGIRFYHGRAFRLQRHLRRLQASAAAIWSLAAMR